MIKRVRNASCRFRISCKLFSRVAASNAPLSRIPSGRLYPALLDCICWTSHNPCCAYDGRRNLPSLAENDWLETGTFTGMALSDTNCLRRRLLIIQPDHTVLIQQAVNQLSKLCLAHSHALGLEVCVSLLVDFRHWLYVITGCISGKPLFHRCLRPP